MASFVSSLSPQAKRVWLVIKTTWVNTWNDDVPFYAAGVAFHSLFSIFSVLFFLSLMLGVFGADPERLRDLGAFLSELVPKEAGQLVQTAMDVVSQPVPQSLVFISLVFTLWTSSNVVQALIHALNRIHHIVGEARAAWRTRLMALAVVGVSGVLFAAAFVLLVLGRDLSGHVYDNPWRNAFLDWYLAGSEPLSILIVFLGGYLLYWLAPNFNHRFRIAWPGALVFTLTWTVTTFGFNIYLRKIAVYDRIYGPVATVVVVLVWVFLSAFWCLVGGEVNAAIRKLRLEEGKTDPEDGPSVVDGKAL